MTEPSSPIADAPQPQTRFVPRPAQVTILDYTGGYMGISAVPGSGKTFTLSLLAARLVERLATTGGMDEREVLVVTFTNSAVANFRARIGGFLREERGLLPGVGYRVRTLHGLAHDIVRERPGLVGLSEDFDIVDERTALEIKREAVHSYTRTHPELFAPYIKPEFLRNQRRIDRYLIDDAVDIANIVIRVAKELQATPAELQLSLDRQSGAWPLLEFGVRMYADYQRALMLRGAVDFDDLIALALQALHADPGYLERLQDRWPYILEDEAQDSSLAQEKMLRLLTQRQGNWVRVGDPNQAINTTFTSADTRFLQRFLREHPEQAMDLPNSGRSALPIIDVANHLIDWARTRHPVLPVELALAPPLIQPTPPGDPQPNPAPGTPPVYIHAVDLTPDKETEMIVRSLQRWLPEHGDMTVAVLVPENARGFALANTLEASGLPFDDTLLRTDSTTRATAQALATVLAFIANPQSPRLLAQVWTEVWYPRKMEVAARELRSRRSPAMARRPWRRSSQARRCPNRWRPLAGRWASCTRPKPLSSPSERTGWTASVGWTRRLASRELANGLRADLQRWTRATILPIDELVLTLGNDLFVEPADIALTHRLAVLLAKLAQENPTWRLPELAGELESIAQNRRRLLGFSEDAAGYLAKPGVVTVATMHAAKGLEWDRVYLTAVNTFSFPSGADTDRYRAERWFVRDGLNLAAETEAQVRQLRMGTLDDYVPGVATQRARLESAAERLRLLYVGITRARRELILTYNTGRTHERDPLGPALALSALSQAIAGSKDNQ